MTEEGAAYFGRDYGHDLAAWVHDQYSLVDQFGAPPFEGPAFGVRVLARRPPRPRARVD
jgi:hypothetical protein